MGIKSMRNAAPSRKLGDKRNEMAKKHRKSAKNFSQSKDIREDRGRRQSKLGGTKNPSFGRR